MNQAFSIFAHNGVEHHTHAEATAHSAGSTAWTVILITVATAALVYVAVWAVNRFSPQTVKTKKEKTDE